MLDMECFDYKDGDSSLEQNVSTISKIVITVESSVGLLLECVVLVILICTKGYKSFLQRFAIWIVVALMVMDITRVTSFGHRALQDIDLCEVIAFVQAWSRWCIYIFLLVMIVYLLVMVYVETRDNSTIVTMVKSSKLSRILIEVSIFLSSLAFPLMVLWIPFFDHVYIYEKYGFNNLMCGMIRSNSSEINNSSMISSYFIMYTPPELAGLVAILAALGMIVVYCTLSADLQGHQHARRLIKNLIVSLLVVFTLTVAFNVMVVVWNIKEEDEYQAYIVAFTMTLVIRNFEKMVLLIGYLLMFHFSKVCNPLKKLIKRSKNPAPHNQKQNREYGTFTESSRVSPYSYTHFSVPYTGEFNSTSKVEH